MDLPIDDGAAMFSTYAEVIVDAFEAEAEAEGMILVAHSMAGLSVPIAASRLPVRAVIFVCGLIAAPGRSLIDQLIDQPHMLVPGYDTGIGEPDDQGRSHWVDRDAARRTLYGDCDDRTVEMAFERLRPQGRATYTEPCPLSALPDLRYAYVVGAEDRLVNPDWSREAAGERLGVTPVELPGSHSPFLARAGALAQVLADHA